MIEVTTVWAHRMRDRCTRRVSTAQADYLALMALQKRSVEKFGHRHRVVSDQQPTGFDVIHAPKLPLQFSKAMVAGQIAAIEAWAGEDHLVLADCDVLITRELKGAFHKDFEIGVTNRDEKTAPINNGVMYIAAGAKEKALALFRRALELTQDHWGGDQEAIAKAIGDVPRREYGVQPRTVAGHEIQIGFLRPGIYNMTPLVNGIAGQGDCYAVHFKGDRKAQMKPYARQFLDL